MRIVSKVRLPVSSLLTTFPTTFSFFYALYLLKDINYTLAISKYETDIVNILYNFVQQYLELIVLYVICLTEVIVDV